MSGPPGVEDDVDPVVGGAEGVRREAAAGAVAVDAVAAVDAVGQRVQRRRCRRRSAK